MSTTIAKVIEISAKSPTSFDAAIKEGLERASATIDKVQGAWIKDQRIIFKDGKISEYRVDMKVTFLIKDSK